jgi:hypothetical protein
MFQHILCDRLLGLGTLTIDPSSKDYLVLTPRAVYVYLETVDRGAGFVLVRCHFGLFYFQRLSTRARKVIMLIYLTSLLGWVRDFCLSCVIVGYFADMLYFVLSKLFCLIVLKCRITWIGGILLSNRF